MVSAAGRPALSADDARINKAAVQLTRHGVDLADLAGMIHVLFAKVLIPAIANAPCNMRLNSRASDWLAGVAPAVVRPDEAELRRCVVPCMALTLERFLRLVEAPFPKDRLNGPWSAEALFCVVVAIAHFKKDLPGLQEECDWSAFRLPNGDGSTAPLYLPRATTFGWCGNAAKWLLTSEGGDSLSDVVWTTAGLDADAVPKRFACLGRPTERVCELEGVILWANEILFATPEETDNARRLVAPATDADVPACSTAEGAMPSRSPFGSRAADTTPAAAGPVDTVWRCTKCNKLKDLGGPHLKGKSEVRSDCWPCAKKTTFKLSPRRPGEVPGVVAQGDTEGPSPSRSPFASGAAVSTSNGLASSGAPAAQADRYAGCFWDMPHFFDAEVDCSCTLLNKNYGFLQKTRKHGLRTRLLKWVDHAGKFRGPLRYVAVPDEKDDDGMVRIIVKDSIRTFSRDDHRKKFTEFLFAMRTELGDYSGGMSFVAGLCLLVLDEAETAAVLRKCAREYIPKHWAVEAVGFVTNAWLIDRIMADREPAVHRHFDKLNLWPETYMGKVLTGLCVHVLPFDQLFMFLDAFMEQGFPWLVKFELAIVGHFREKLLSVNETDMNTLFEIMRLDARQAGPDDTLEIYQAALRYDLGGSLDNIGTLRLDVYNTKVAPRLARGNQAGGRR